MGEERGRVAPGLSEPDSGDLRRVAAKGTGRSPLDPKQRGRGHGRGPTKMAAVPAGEPVKKKEIYTYNAPWEIYGMSWSLRPDHR